MKFKPGDVIVTGSSKRNSVYLILKVDFKYNSYEFFCLCSVFSEDINYSGTTGFNGKFNHYRLLKDARLWKGKYP